MKALSPRAKIAEGVILTLLVVTAPVGIPLLLIGCFEAGRPEGRIHVLVNRARARPAEAGRLLLQATAIDPHNPEVLGALADRHFAAGDFAGALPIASEYCALVPQDWVARGHLAIAEIQCNHIAEAISELEVLYQESPTDPDGKQSLTAYLAFAHLAQGDPDQARALVSTTAGRATASAPGAQQCLFYLAVCDYLLGHSERAVAALDRLYALNPGYAGLGASKSAMRAGTYELPLPGGRVLARSASTPDPTRPTWEMRGAQGNRCENCGAPLGGQGLACGFCHAPGRQ